jgi:PEP-CTERM motif
MRRLFTILATVLLTVVGVGSAHATVVTFDDLTGAGTLADGYGGITWNGQWDYYDFAQFPYTPKSDFERIYNNTQSSPSEFSFGAPSVFDGAWFSGYADVDGFGANPIHFDLYDGATLVWTSGTLLPSDTPAFLASGYSGLVTRVAVSSDSGDYYVMDDVTFNGSAPVPEPASLTLLGLGLAGMGARRWRQRKA